MTMMTPLGRGGPMYARRRRWPRLLGVIIIVVLLVGVGIGSWWWFSTDDNTPAATDPAVSKECGTPTPKTPKVIPPPDQVNVTVANGTDRAGLANDTAMALEAEDFVIAGVENTERPVTRGTALVRYGKRGLPAAIRLASHVPEAELTPVSRIKGSTIHLWLGPDFTEVVTTDQADVDTVTLPPEEPVCRKR